MSSAVTQKLTTKPSHGYQGFACQAARFTLRPHRTGAILAFIPLLAFPFLATFSAFADSSGLFALQLAR